MTGVGTDRGGVTLRAIRPTDAAAVRALVAPEIERLGYRESLGSAVDAAIAGRDPDSRAIVALDAVEVIGLVMHGAIAGAVGTGRVQFVVVDRNVRRRGIATRLIEGAASELAQDGYRAIFVELPDDPTLIAGRHLLASCRFGVEARVADYFRDGVDLVILRRDIGGSSADDHSPRAISS